MLFCSFFDSEESVIVESTDTDLYQYTAYIGEHTIPTKPKSSYWYVNTDIVGCFTGNHTDFKSELLCVEIFGYTPEDRTSSYHRYTDLPYINGCSSKQLIPPNRLGDPTLQMLYIPENTSEQEHHIHSTTRIVYVAKGHGFSHVGTKDNFKTTELYPGLVIVLDKMVPHHFSTKDSELIVLPLHIFSSIGNAEQNHPMFNGTHRV